MYYLVTVGYETGEQDNNGNSRMQKVKYVIESDSVEEVVYVMANYHKNDAVDSQILDVKRHNVGEIILRTNNPLLYKK